MNLLANRHNQHRRMLRTCLAIGLAAGSLVGSHASAEIIQKSGQPTPKTPTPKTTVKKVANISINVTYEGVDAQQNVILKYGSVKLKTKLAGLKLKPGAAGVLALLLPDGVQLQAEVVEKGAVQTIILRNREININDQLLIQGVAEGIR